MSPFALDPQSELREQLQKFKVAELKALCKQVSVSFRCADQATLADTSAYSMESKDTRKPNTLNWSTRYLLLRRRQESSLPHSHCHQATLIMFIKAIDIFLHQPSTVSPSTIGSSLPQA